MAKTPFYEKTKYNTLIDKFIEAFVKTDDEKKLVREIQLKGLHDWLKLRTQQNIANDPDKNSSDKEKKKRAKAKAMVQVGEEIRYRKDHPSPSAVKELTNEKLERNKEAFNKIVNEIKSTNQINKWVITSDKKLKTDVGKFLLYMMSYFAKKEKEWNTIEKSMVCIKADSPGQPEQPVGIEDGQKWAKNRASKADSEYYKNPAKYTSASDTLDLIISVESVLKEIDPTKLTSITEFSSDVAVTGCIVRKADGKFNFDDMNYLSSKEVAISNEYVNLAVKESRSKLANDKNIASDENLAKTYNAFFEQVDKQSIITTGGLPVTAGSRLEAAYKNPTEKVGIDGADWHEPTTLSYKNGEVTGLSRRAQIILGIVETMLSFSSDELKAFGITSEQLAEKIADALNQLKLSPIECNFFTNEGLKIAGSTFMYNEESGFKPASPALENKAVPALTM